MMAQLIDRFYFAALNALLLLTRRMILKRQHSLSQSSRISRAHANIAQIVAANVRAIPFYHWCKLLMRLLALPSGCPTPLTSVSLCVDGATKFQAAKPIVLV